MAIGFPTLINTSPSYGYDENTIAKLTPVTTFYQEAYAEQETFGILSSYYFDPVLSTVLLVMPTTLDDLPPEDPLQYFERMYGQGIQLEFGFIEFDSIQESLTANINKSDFLPPIIKEILDFEILPSAYAVHSINSTILFEDPFEIQPASNGWTETCPACTASSGIFFFSPSSTAFRISSTGAPSTIFGLERSLDTTGFSDVAFNLTAHQLSGTYEVADYLSFEVDFGNGTFITILQDVRHWSGVDNRITDPDPSGNTVPTSTGFVSLPPIADNNPNLKIRIEGKFNSQTISPPLEGYFIDHIQVTATGHGQSVCDSDIGESFRVVCHTFDLDEINGLSSTNLGTLGSNADAQYFVPSTNLTATAIVTNTTGALINESIFQDGSVDGVSTAEVRMGLLADRAQWSFLHKLNVGSNITSINLWINGDTVGGADYPILDTIELVEVGASGGNGLVIFSANGEMFVQLYNDDTISGSSDLELPFSIPDDGAWHMLTVLIDKGNLTGIGSPAFVKVCIDGSTNCNTADSTVILPVTSSIANNTLTLGSRHDPFGNIVENKFSIDDLAIWNGYQLSQTEINSLFALTLTASNIQSISDVAIVVDSVELTLIPAPPTTAPTNFILTLDNINTEHELSWDAVPLATDYVVQRLSTERQIERNNSLTGDNNFGAGGIAVGDFAGISVGEIITMTGTKTGTFSGAGYKTGKHFGGYWFDVIIGVGNIDNVNPTGMGELEQTGFMISAGTRLSRDCNSGLGVVDSGGLGIKIFNLTQKHDGYTKWNDGTYTDGACIAYARYLGTQLTNLTDTTNTEIAGHTTVNASASITTIREGVGTGLRLFSATTGLWDSTVEIETGVWVMNNTFVNITTTASTSFVDTTTNNFNSYFYRIIPTNAGGEGSPSIILNGTLSIPPLRVADLNGTDNSGSVDLVWSEAEIKKSRELSEDPVLGYLIQRNIVANETTLHDGLSNDVFERFMKNDNTMTPVSGGQGTTGGAPSHGSDLSHGGQMLNITSAVNITRMVIKVGVGLANNFNTEPDIAGAIFTSDGELIARTIFPRVHMAGDMGVWHDGDDDNHNFVNFAFSPPVELAIGEYAFVWSSLNKQTCNSASCGLGNADTGDFKFFFDHTNNGDADGYAIGDIQGGGIDIGANKLGIGGANNRTNDYALAIYAEDPNWITIGTNLGATNLTFTDSSSPIAPDFKAYRIIAFNNAGLSEVPTLLHNPQGTLLGQHGNTTEFFAKDSQGRNTAGGADDITNPKRGLNVGEVLTFAVAVPTPDQVTGLVITQEMNNNATLDWNDALNADNYQVLRKVNTTESEVNTNSTWSWRAFRSGSVGIDATCSAFSSGSGATGGIVLRNTDSGDDANCNFWKFFPRDFINNTRIQFSYTLTHIFGTQFTTRTLVGTENDPQANRFDDRPPNTIGYGTVVPNWVGGISNDGVNLRGSIDVNSVAITSVQTTDEMVDLQSQWDVADSDYISLVFQTDDNSLASSRPDLKIFWINITDFDTLEQKAFYNFSGVTTVTERGGNCDSGAPSTCGFGRFDSGTTVITTEIFEEIGTPITSDFEDSTLPITGVSTYKVRGNNTDGFGLNSTEVDFGLIQEIDGITDIGGGLFTGSLNATALNSTAIKLTWDQATTEHPTDPLTGVIIQRSVENVNTNSTWYFREGGSLSGTFDPICSFTVTTGTDGHFELFASDTSDHRAQSCTMFKTFPRDFLNDTRIQLNYVLQHAPSVFSLFGNTFVNTQDEPNQIERDDDSEWSRPAPHFVERTGGFTSSASDVVGDIDFQALTLQTGTTRATIDLVDLQSDWDKQDTDYSSIIFEIQDDNPASGQQLKLRVFWVNITDFTTGAPKAFYNFSGGVRTNDPFNFNPLGCSSPDECERGSINSGTAIGTLGESFTSIATVDELVTAFNDTGLEDDITYTYRAKGQSAVSTGAFGDNNTATTLSLPLPDQVTGLNITQNMNNNATLDWNDALNADNYQVLRKTNFTEGFNVNTNGTWQFREFKQVGGQLGGCRVLDAGTGATGGVELLSFDSGAKLSVCDMWKHFPRDFLNNTRLQFKYDFTHSSTTSGITGNTFVATRNDPNQVSRDNDSQWATTGTSRNWLGTSPDVPDTIDTQSLILAGGVIQDDMVDVSGNWNKQDTDYVSVVFRVTDSSILTQNPTLKIFWLNITDFDTGLQKAFYNFSGGQDTLERSSITNFPFGCDDELNSPMECSFGIYNVGSFTVANDIFEEIGTPITSDFEDSTIPLQGVSTYKVRGNNTGGFGLNSTEVDFGLIQPIQNLNATALNSTAVGITWDLATTEHPTDPLTGVIIQRSLNINGTWQWYERDDSGGGFSPACNTTDGSNFVVMINSGGGDGCTMFMSFDRTEIDSLGVTHAEVDWSGIFTGITQSGGNARIKWFDFATELNRADIVDTGIMEGITGNDLTFSLVGDHDASRQLDLESRNLCDNSVCTERFYHLAIILDDTTGLSNQPEIRVYGIKLLNTTSGQTLASWTFDASSHTNEVAGEFGTFEATSNFTINGAVGGVNAFATIGTVDDLVTAFNDTGEAFLTTQGTGLEKETSYTYRTKGQSAVSTGSFGATNSATTATGLFEQTESDIVTVLDDERFLIDKVIRNVNLAGGGGGADTESVVNLMSLTYENQDAVDLLLPSGGIFDGFIGNVFSTDSGEYPTSFRIKEVFVNWGTTLPNPSITGTMSAVILTGVTIGGSVGSTSVVEESDGFDLSTLPISYPRTPFSGSGNGQGILFNFTGLTDLTVTSDTFIGIKLVGINATDLHFTGWSFDSDDGEGACVFQNATDTFAVCPFGALGLEIGIIAEDTTDFETTGGIEPDKLVLHHNFDSQTLFDSTAFPITQSNLFKNAGTAGDNGDISLFNTDMHQSNSSGFVDTGIIAGHIGDGAIFVDGGLGSEGQFEIGFSDPNRAEQFSFLSSNETNTYSINFWINGTWSGIAIGSFLPIISNQGQDGSDGIVIGVDDGGDIIFDIESGGTPTSPVSSTFDEQTAGSNSLVDNVWSMVTIIMEKSNVTSTAKICLNGDTLGNCDLLDRDAPFRTKVVFENRLSIGDQNPDSFDSIVLPDDRKFFAMDELCIWENYKLTTTDINALFNSGTGTVCGTVSAVVGGGGGGAGLTTGDLVNATDTVIITPPTIPEGILDLTGNTVGNTCQLSWSAPITTSVINGYTILRQVDGVGGFITLIANTSNTNTNFIDTLLVNNVLYEYDVKAGNRFGFTTVSSNIVDCMPVVNDVPSVPSPLIAVEEANGDVTLTWVEPLNGDPFGYQIQRKIQAGGFLILVNDTATTALTFLDTATDPAVEYTWRIAGWNSLGLGAFSNQVTLLMASPANAPVLTAQQVVNVITINWTQPASDNPINGYKIEKRINFGSLFTLVANTTNTSLSFVDSNVTKPDTFGYRVRALSSSGEGTVSNIVDVVFGSHIIVQVREQDGSGFKGGGIVRGVNATLSLPVGLDTNSNAIFDNLDVGNYNFTFFDDDNYILNKTFNFPAPAGNDTSSFTISALVFDVDCPDNGIGSDIRIKLNYTDAKDIISFPSTPVCDSTDQVSWSTRWQGSAVNDTSTMIADFISTVFKANAEQFLASADIIPTIFNSGENQIESETFVVNMTDVTINFNLFLGRAPSGGGGGGGGGTPPFQAIPELKILLEQRLTGLSLLSRTHGNAMAGDVIEGSISVEWEGDQGLSVTGIDVGEFTDIIRFTIPPFAIEQEIEGIGEFAISSGDIPYVITLPPFICDEMLGITLNCVNEELIGIDIQFEFESEGVTYQAQTMVMVDLRPIPFDLPQFQIILLGIVLLVSAIAGNFIRQRIRGNNTQSGKSRARKKKFKKKFDSS